jgi:molybdopterin-guanine dinucleotide biosynthesis protein A
VGVVLAGGSSRRFGRDKARVEIEGVTLAERARRTLGQVCVEVLVADAGRGVLPDAESVPDGPGRGPAAGILGAAARRPGSPLVVLACDLPHVPAELLRRLARARGDWVVPRRREGLEPLCALYRPRAIERLAAQVAAGRVALHPLAGDPRLEVRYLEPVEILDLGDPAHLFWNVNTPQDLI